MDQGYAFKVLCDIPPENSDSGTGSKLMPREDQLRLLTDVLATTEVEGELELSPEDADIVLTSRDSMEKEESLADRRNVSLSDLTGADIFFYDEWDVRHTQ